MQKDGTVETKDAPFQFLSDDGFVLGIIFFGLSMIVVLVPLPFGAARPLTWDILGLSIALLVLVSCAIRDINNLLLRDLLWPSVLFGLVLIYVIFQIVPAFPVPWQNSIWDLAAEALGRQLPGRIAIDPAVALIDLFRLSFYAAVFYLAFISCRLSSHARMGISLVKWSGSLYAVYALAIYWSGNKTILWFPKWAYLTSLTGTFVNANNFATYLGLCLLASLCDLTGSLGKLHLHGNWRQKVDTTVNFMTAHTLSLISLFILSTALFLTHSRGGFISTVVGAAMFFVGTFILSKTAVRSQVARTAVIFTAVVFVFGALLISGGVTVERLFGTDINGEERLMVYRITWEAIRDYPIFGTGFGSFSSIFPIYRTGAISHYFDMAHNDYLQNMLELGVPAAICLFVTVMWLSLLCLRGIRVRQRDAMFPCLGLAGSVLVGLHAMVDFSLQIPAVTVTFMFLLGIGVAQSRSSRAVAVKAPSDVE